MSTKARHLRKSARHKKYHHELWKLKSMYKEYPEVNLERMRQVAWWLSEPVKLPKGWRKYTFTTGIVLSADEMLPMMVNGIATEK